MKLQDKMCLLKDKICSNFDFAG